MRLLVRIQLISLLLFLSHISWHLYAHDKTISLHVHQADSLKKELLNKSLSKKEKMILYARITGIYASFDIDSVLAYALITDRLATELNDELVKMKNYHHWGIAYCFRSKFDSAFYCIEKARDIAIRLNLKEAIAGSYGLDAFIYMQQNKPLTAIDHYLKALANYDEIKDKNPKIYSNITVNLARLGQLNRELNNTDITLVYLNRALETIKYITDPVAYEWRLTKVYNEFAEVFFDQGDLNKAFEYAQMAYNKYTRTLPLNQCQTNVLLARIHLLQHNPDKAQAHAKEAMDNANIIKDRKLYNSAKLILSQIYLIEKKYRKAEEIALSICQSDSTDINDSHQAVYNIALANTYMHNEEKAALYLHKYAEMQKEYAKKSFQTTVADISVKYETRKKELRILALEKEKQFYIWFGVGIILFTATLGLILWLTIRNNRKEKQLIAIRSVMDGEMKERTRLAHDLHDRLGGNLSAVKIGLADENNLSKDTNIKLDACIEEVRDIAHNLMPASLQYGLKLALEDFTAQFPTVHFHFFGEDYRMDKQAEYVIYCCANELVNNAIRHAEAENINIQLIQNGKYITLTVQDDGKGFDEKVFTNGLGIKNIRDRITSCKGKIDIISSPNYGTEITIEITLSETNAFPNKKR